MTVAPHRHDLRHDTAADWTAANPILAAGEAGLESDTGKLKFGDGATAWSSLPYFTTATGTNEPLMTVTASKAGNYTAAINEFVPFDTTAAGRTLTLPNAPADGTKVGARLDAGTNTVTINRAGSDSIAASGTTSMTLSYPSESVVLKYRASDHVWVVVEHGYAKTTFVPATRLLTAGFGLSGLGDLSVDRTPAVTLPKAGATIGGDVSASASTLTTIFTTSSLAAGTWLLTADATFVSGTGGLSLETQFVVASGTATFTGPTSKAARANTNAVEFGTSLTTIVNVTVAATITFQGIAGATWTAKASTSTNSYANATGWTAVRIA
jgi:hypothetical protein